MVVGYLQHLNGKADEMSECCQESLATLDGIKVDGGGVFATFKWKSR